MGASGEYLDSVVLDRAADSLVSRSGAVAWALTDGGVRIQLPDDPRFGRVTGLPTGRETVVDFVVPADRMVVVDVWERAQVVGLAHGDVRLSSDPARAVTFTIVDGRHRYGVWLGFLIAEDRWKPAADTPPVDVSLLVPTRPRTATMHKNMCAVITHVDDRVERMLGWTAADMLGRRSLDFIHPDDHHANARLASILGVADATSMSELLSNLPASSRDELSGALSAAMGDHADRRVEIEIEIRGPARRGGVWPT